MNSLFLLVILGFVGGIGLLIGTATGFARGRLGLPRGRALLMACFYSFIIFPIGCAAVLGLLAATGVYRTTEFTEEGFVQILLAFTVAGLISALPAGVAAFFAHVLSWNRHHARKLGPPPEPSAPPPV